VGHAPVKILKNNEGTKSKFRVANTGHTPVRGLGKRTMRTISRKPREAGGARHSVPDEGSMVGSKLVCRGQNIHSDKTSQTFNSEESGQIQLKEGAGAREGQGKDV